MAVSGLAMGIIDTIANIQLVTIYQKDSAVFLQVIKLVSIIFSSEVMKKALTLQTLLKMYILKSKSFSCVFSC